MLVCDRLQVCVEHVSLWFWFTHSWSCDDIWRFGRYRGDFVLQFDWNTLRLRLWTPVKQIRICKWAKLVLIVSISWFNAPLIINAQWTFVVTFDLNKPESRNQYVIVYIHERWDDHNHKQVTRVYKQFLFLTFILTTYEWNEGIP